MKTLYLECNMGAAGDMLLAALLELHPDRESFLQRLNTLGLPGVVVAAQPATRCGITGTYVSVQIDGIAEEDEHHHHSHSDDHNHSHSHDDSDRHHHHHHHDHNSMQDISAILASLPVSQEVRHNAEAVYRHIALAESHAHGVAVEQIHFHEVGNLDAIADIVGVCMLIDELAPEQILASAINVGSGMVKCAHGILPVPAPATAFILKDVPIYSGAVKSELCTPTGAALLKHFVSRFDVMPEICVSQIGYGMGKKEFAQANCLRAFIGETLQPKQHIVELSCNLDDMTPEAIGFAMQMLLDHGAVDVYTTAIGMKKNRPGIMLTCMCSNDLAEELVKLMFLHTSTIGIRQAEFKRYTLSREEQVISTEYGSLRRKLSHGYGVSRSKWEYDDLARIAKEKGISLADAACLFKADKGRLKES